MTDPVFDRRMMRCCIELAASAKESGHSPVGCVITLETEIIAEAGELCPAGSDPFAHAEILAVVTAIRVVGQEKLSGTTLYTTNEPCFLCSYSIREARIGRVVFSVETPEIGGATSRYPILSARDITRWSTPPRIEQGLLGDEYRKTRREKGKISKSWDA